MARYQFEIRVVDAQHGVILVLDCQCAACGRPDDVVALAHPARQFANIAPRISPRRLEIAVALHGQAAAVLFRQGNFDLIALEDFHGRFCDARFVVVRRTAVEVRHFAHAHRPLAQHRPFEPRPERSPREIGEPRPGVNADDAFDEQPQWFDFEGDVRERPEKRADFAQQFGAAQRPVPEWQSIALHDPGAGNGVHLGKLHAVRADERARAAAGAVVERLIGRGQTGMAKALRLRANCLRAGEKIGHRGHRAGRGADVALDAKIGGEGGEVHATVSTARHAVPNSIPSRDPSLNRSAPARIEPMARRFDAMGLPSALSGCMFLFTRRPNLAKGCGPRKSSDVHSERLAGAGTGRPKTDSRILPSNSATRPPFRNPPVARIPASVLYSFPRPFVSAATAALPFSIRPLTTGPMISRPP